MNKIKIFEKTDSGLVEGLNFNYVSVGQDFVTKTLCFSPVGCNLADLKVRVEEKSDFIFTKSEDHITSDWKNITPFKIMEGEISNPVKIEFLVKSGPVRIDNFRLLIEYLEIPNEIE